MAIERLTSGESDLERTYAAVLGKMAGVFLGRPVEGWPAARIRALHGDVTGFLPGTVAPVSDDDLSGAFTFVRAVEDHGYPTELTPPLVGEAWLEYLVERKTTLWWGGIGSSTEHTAHARLMAGIPAPRSGSATTNGRQAAEQIGGRIFADAWGLVYPRDPARAARVARAAAQVSHDGVAVDAAGMLAATVAAAFEGEGVVAAMLRGRATLPTGSPLHDLIDEVGEVLDGVAAGRVAAGGAGGAGVEGADWRAAFAVLADRHPYARYGGHCPLLPNEAAMLLALLAAPDDLGRALSIAVGCGWDTDCNAGNVGCVIGAALGLEAFAPPRALALRTAMNDRLFVVAAEGGESVTDALTVARRLRAYALRSGAGNGVSDEAATGSRAVDARPWFDFAVQGATQGFRLEPPARADEASSGAGSLTVPGGRGGLIASLGTMLAAAPPGASDRPAAATWRLVTPTFSRAEERSHPGYALVASPTLYPGQTVRALVAGTPGLRARLVVDGDVPDAVVPDAVDPDAVVPRALARGPEVALAERPQPLVWCVPPTAYPIAAVGLELRFEGAAGAPRPSAPPWVRLQRLHWDGGPGFSLDGDALWAWRHAWVDAFDHVHADPGGGIAFAHDRSGGWAAIGGRAWGDVRFGLEARLPYQGEAGIFVRGRGVRRRIALVLRPGAWRLELGGAVPEPLAAGRGGWERGDAIELALEVASGRVRAWVDGDRVGEVGLPAHAAPSGAVGVLAGPGTLSIRSLTLSPGDGGAA